MNYTYVTDASQLEELQVDAKHWPLIGIDVETTGLDFLTDKVILIQLGNRAKQYVIDVYKFLNPKQDLQIVWDILLDENSTKIFHNGKFDYQMLKTNFGIRDIANVADTWIAENLISNGKRRRGFGLSDVLEKYLDVKLDKDIRLQFVNKILGSSFEKEELDYAALDVAYLPELITKQSVKLQKDNMLQLARLEFETFKATADMEINGIYLDAKKWMALEKGAKERLLKAAKELDKQFESYRKQLLKERGEQELPLDDQLSINYNSPLQLRKALSFILNKTIPSTDVKVLKRLSHPAVKALLAYREAAKKLSTYGETFLKQHVNKKTRRIHSSFNQMEADSGRYSSSKPNLQNIPKKKEYRAAFTAQKSDYKIITSDYSG